MGTCENNQHVVGADGMCHPCAEIYPDRPYSDGFYCVQCTEELGGLYFYDGKCTSECPQEAPIADEYKVCRTCPEIDSSRPLWDEGKCGPCPTYLPRWDGKCCN